MHRELKDGTPEGNAAYISGGCTYGTHMPTDSAESLVKMEKRKDSTFRTDSAGEEDEREGVLRNANKKTAEKRNVSGNGRKSVNAVHLRNDSAVEAS